MGLPQLEQGLVWEWWPEVSWGVWPRRCLHQCKNPYRSSNPLFLRGRRALRQNPRLHQRCRRLHNRSSARIAERWLAAERSVATADSRSRKNACVQAAEWTCRRAPSSAPIAGQKSTEGEGEENAKELICKNSTISCCHTRI